MRDYFTERNLLRAVALASAVTAMAVPRILAGNLRPAFFIPAAFVCLILVSGAATAWSNRGGLPGLFPADAWKGLLIAFGLAVVLAPVARRWLDPVLQGAIADSGNLHLMSLQYPDTPGAVVALALWTAGFELVFLVGAGVSFFARILGNRWLAVAAAAVLRVLVVWKQVQLNGLQAVGPFFLLDAAVGGLLAGLLFARFGLLPPMLLTALMDLRLLL